ncbi:hypothetical protein BGW42_003197 [Actinomortierella wolfii]|nr:hypothetical protein BGW42_003197 [Actinomortierella wolfii]
MVHLVETADEFHRLIQENKRVLTKFFGDWCGPCKLILPKMEELEKQYPDVVFIKVNIGDLLDIAENAQVFSTPTFQTYLNGQVHARIQGADIDKVTAAVENLAVA